MRKSIIAFACSVVGLSAETSAEIRGRVIDAITGNSVVLSSVKLTVAGSPASPLMDAELETKGTYRFQGVHEGEYDVIIRAYLFRRLEIRSIRVTGALLTLPTLRIEFQESCAPPNTVHALYYRPIGAEQNGILSGRVLNERGEAVAGAALVLFHSGSARIAATTSDLHGSFSFPGLQARPDYWIGISAPGHFADEIAGLTVQSGFEAVYSKALEACAPGSCRPHLKSLQVHPGCCLGSDHQDGARFATIV